MKTTLTEERETNRINNDNLYKKIENLLMKQEQENNNISEVMQKNLKNLRDYIEVMIKFYLLYRLKFRI